jgi:hypothetical protein
LFSTNSDRQKVLKDYEAVAQMTGHADRGHLLFTQNCAQCHRLKDEGNAAGPDLGMLSDKPASVFLAAILDPNQAVEARVLIITSSPKTTGKSAASFQPRPEPA